MQRGTVQAVRGGGRDGSYMMPGRSAEDSKKHVGRSALRVLLVDDEAQVLRSYGQLLARDGLVVEAVESGEAAIRFARSRAFDAIILDQRLPALSGVEVLERLRAMGIETPTIILTGFPDAESAFTAGTLGAACYLQKSAITGSRLVKAVREAVGASVLRTGQSSTAFADPSGRPSHAFSKLLQLSRSVEGVSAEAVRKQIARTLVLPELRPVEFVVAARALHLISTKEDLPLDALLAQVNFWIREANESGRPPDRFLRLIASVDATKERFLQPTTAVRTAPHGVSDATDSFQLTGSIHVTVQQCKRLVMMRHAVSQLLNLQEQVRQIAYALGYTDAANFDHDFRRFFGMTPTQFRHLQ